MLLSSGAGPRWGGARVSDGPARARVCVSPHVAGVPTDSPQPPYEPAPSKAQLAPLLASAHVAIQLHAPGDLDTHAYAFEIAMRKGKHLLVRRASRKCSALPAYRSDALLPGYAAASWPLRPRRTEASSRGVMGVPQTLRSQSFGLASTGVAGAAQGESHRACRRGRSHASSAACPPKKWAANASAEAHEVLWGKWHLTLAYPSGGLAGLVPYADASVSYFCRVYLPLVSTSQVTSFLKQTDAKELPPLVAKVIALQRAKLA